MNSFRYALVDENGEYYYMDNGVVRTSPSAVFSYTAPFNWKDTEIRIERKMSEMGLFRTFTLPASFTTNMAAIIRALYIDYGYEAYAKLVIEKRKNYTTDYSLFAEGEIDFSEYNDTRQGSWTVSVNLMDNGIAEFLKSIETTTYEINLNDAEAITVNMDGIELRNKARWVVTDGSNPSNNPTGAHIWNADIVTVESLNQLDVKSVAWKNWSTAADFYDDYLFKASAAREITFTYDFYIDFNSIPGASYSVNKPFIQIFKADDSGSGSNTSVHTILDLTSEDPAIFLNQIYHVTGSFTTTPDVGDRFYFSTRLTPTPSGTNYINFNYGADSFIELDYFDRVPAFPIKAMRFWHVLKKLIEYASGGKYSISSVALTAPAYSNDVYLSGINNIPWFTALTSGDALRGLDNAVIKVTYGQLRDFIRNTWGFGLAPEGNLLRIERLTEIFNKNNVALTIDKLSKFRFFAAKDLFYKGIKIGYEEQTYDLLNGKDEFNTTHEYKLPVIRPTQTLDMVNSIRADIYGIEYIRYNRYLKDSTDSKFDNSVFALELEPLDPTDPADTAYNLLRRPGSIQGIINATTAYNFGLTPKSCLIRNLPYIYSILPNTTDGTITFQTTDKNRSLRTSIGVPGLLIDEDADIIVESSIFRPSEPLFLPHYVEFECSPPDTFPETIASNPYSVVRFRYGRNYFKGFIVSAGIKPAQNDIYVFRLLLTPDNDLQLLKKK